MTLYAKKEQLHTHTGRTIPYLKRRELRFKLIDRGSQFAITDAYTSLLDLFLEN